MMLASRLRRYPYPFRAAFALCPDADGVTMERVEMLQDFWKSVKLDVAVSFFPYVDNPDGPPQTSFFGGQGDKIVEAMRKGWIDALHGIGDFAPGRRCTRAQARRALDELTRRGVRVTVWSNHGGPHHTNNLVIPTAQGDIRDEREDSPYVFDLLQEYGIRFVWASEITHLVGQNRPSTAGEYYFSYPGVSSWRRILAWMAHVLGAKTVIRKLNCIPFTDNRLVWAETLRDGRKTLVFRRYGFWRWDTLDVMDKLLSRQVLDRLVTLNRAMILYLHIGPPKGETPEGLKRGLEACREISRRQERGEIWVQRTSRLLEYVVRRDGLQCRFFRDGEKTIYAVDSVKDPLRGSYVPRPADLEGITFYADEPARTEIRLEGHVPLAARINTPDETGKGSLTIEP